MKEYREKRDFRRTQEPSGGGEGSSEKPIFVIQKHDASNLHYDFRLEVDGVQVLGSIEVERENSMEAWMKEALVGLKEC